MLEVGERRHRVERRQRAAVEFQHAQVDERRQLERRQTISAQFEAAPSKRTSAAALALDWPARGQAHRVRRDIDGVAANDVSSLHTSSSDTRRVNAAMLSVERRKLVHKLMATAGARHAQMNDLNDDDAERRRHLKHSMLDARSLKACTERAPRSTRLSIDKSTLRKFVNGNR